METEGKITYNLVSKQLLLAFSYVFFLTLQILVFLRIVLIIQYIPLRFMLFV